MKERAGIISMGDNPLTLVGDEIEVGTQAPDFTVLDNDLNPVQFSSFSGKVCIISSVPSLDTPVCDIQTRRFNDELAQLGSDVEVLTISMDLPFAQKRWCGASDVTRVKTLSDHMEASFGQAFGVLIKELRLLARAVFVTDRAGGVRHIQIVEDLTKEPDYDAALEAAKNCATR
jgi:thiol peroxidase